MITPSNITPDLLPCDALAYALSREHGEFLGLLQFDTYHNKGLDILSLPRGGFGGLQRPAGSGATRGSSS